MKKLEQEIIECAVADGFTYKQDDTLEVFRAQYKSGKDMGEWWIQVSDEKGTRHSFVRRVSDEDLKQWRRDKMIDEILK